jgi:hypothetical protein
MMEESIETAAQEPTPAAPVVMDTPATTSPGDAAMPPLTACSSSYELSKIKIGSLIVVYWSMDNKWYPCKVVGNVPNLGENFYNLRYSDGEVEEGIDLSLENFKFIGPNKASTRGIASTTKGSSTPAKRPPPLYDSDGCTLSAAENKRKKLAIEEARRKEKKGESK